MKSLQTLCAFSMPCLLALAGCSKTNVATEVATNGHGKAVSVAASGDVVRISSAQQTQAGIRTAAVETHAVPQSLTVTGKVVMDERQTAHIGALADGIVDTVSVLPGDIVRAGQPLAHIHSHLIHETAASLAQAYAEVEQKKGSLQFAQQARTRYAHLYNIKAASLEEDQRAIQQLVQAQGELTIAQANVRREREHLSELVQVNPETLNVDNIFKYEDVPVRTPLGGVVIKRNVTPATVVQAGTETFVVTNLSTVWVTGAVSERDIPLVRIGSLVSVKVQGYPDEIFHGSVGQVGSTLDPETRTIPVRVIVPNPGQRLKPEMFATATIDETATKPALFVPEDSLQEIRGVPSVFVLTDADHFRAQSVSPGTRSDRRVEVLQGLKPGDRIAVSGAFMVKSGLLESSVGEK
jgi:multidrug efflux pump subunit AcrA (membrane-fusion protein)